MYPTRVYASMLRALRRAGPASASARFLSSAAATTAAAPRKPTLILGIETSCDDTSVAIVNSDREVLSLVTKNQNKLHEATGGIVPTAAAIAHSMALPGVLREALDRAGLDTPAKLDQLDAIAVTRGPGLAPCLGVGLCAAKNLAGMLNKPLIGVHHMEAHALTPRLTEPVQPAFPYLSLLVSGGHTLLILTEGLSKHTILGTSLDDAVGESFDKVSRFLGLAWLPTGGGAGAALEQAALRANGSYPVKFTVPLRDGRDKPHTRLNFSFSGLKTQVDRRVALIRKEHGLGAKDPLPAEIQADIARAFQDSAVAHLEDRLRRTLGELVKERKIPVTSVVVAGGVAANQFLRERLTTVAGGEFSLPLMVPPPRLCTDNAAMIAWAGIERFHAGMTDPWELDFITKWPLSELGKEKQ
ncbi:Mitochondrial tRNAs modification protein [Blastocladiella emersonii ATCC 22665]|nr:Mitochondrial tRNAs modification protein [Blastocladiella emersonii ATCC 22665]